MSNSTEPKKVTVTLLFKYTIRSKFTFVLSYNEAMHSGFLVSLLENDEEKEHYVYEVPKALYYQTRELDLKQFYNLWIGKELFSKYDIPHGRYDYSQILKLIRAFNLNQQLPFVERLESVYQKIEQPQKRQQKDFENENHI